jgi:hypothetical protein
VIWFDLYIFHIDLDFVFDKALKVAVVNDVEMNWFVLVDDYNHQPKHVMMVLDKEIIMLMIDDVLQLMLKLRLVEVLMDLLDDDFLLSKRF